MRVIAQTNCGPPVPVVGYGCSMCGVFLMHCALHSYGTSVQRISYIYNTRVCSRSAEISNSSLQANFLLAMAGKHAGKLSPEHRLTLGSGTGSRVGIRAPATATGRNERTTRGARGILVHLCGLRPRLRLTVWLTPEQSRHQSRLAAGALPTGGAVLRRRASSVCASAGRRAPTACMSLSSRAHV